ncbi:glutathione peroxidase [Klebsormidium nitens]|uniref:Glutathione peroxidase n=1 Tax=Klebsormidium nitens TaxID=105231 RepID=A0A0U9HJ24_KLENI|nr:glutathione peroxidase [Klebsormidium nitens]|eukprot:GAQ79439.1 glutathione peroxidase [Klebsormidium nitens]
MTAMGCSASTAAASQPAPRSPKRKLEKLPKSFHALKVPDIRGNVIDFATFKGKVVLVINVASRCGHAMKNYREMVGLYKRYGGPEFEIIAVPCNQFFNQEPGSNEDIEDFVRKQGGEFMVAGKCNVNGQNMSPLYRYLKKYCKDHGAVGWNFTKYLISKSGEIVERYGYKIYPYSFERDIVRLLDGDYSNRPPLPRYDDEPLCVNNILFNRPTMQQILTAGPSNF